MAKDYKYEITSISKVDNDTVLLLKHSDGNHTEVVFTSTGIGMWYKDAEYDEIDFPKLEKIYKEG